jgi:phosphatidate cytidylyltransferase
MSDDEERGSGFDDLFEDLDKFFAPEDRPEDRPQERRRRGAGAEGEREAAAGKPEGDEGEAAGKPAGEPAAAATEARPSEAPAEEDILPTDWLSDIEGLDLGEPADLTPSGAETEAPSPGPPAPSGAPLGATAEMSQQDWSRLRQVLGDEVNKEGEEVGVVPDAGGGSAEDLFRYEEEEGEEGRHELTLEDLKKAPAEYRHLPGPDDEVLQDDRDAIREDQGAFLGEREGVRDEFTDVGERPLVPEAAARQPWKEAAAKAGERWDEPAISEVEAAADQMAEEFRTGLPTEDELLADLRRPGQPRTVKVGEPESLVGPSWEEPGSQVITTEPPGPAFAGRNLPMALLTAAVLAVLALISIAIDKAFFAFIAGGVVLVGQAEVYAAMHRKGYQPATALGLVLGGMMLAAGYLKGEQAMLFFVGLGVVLSFLWYMAAAPKAREGTLVNIGATMLGLIYVPMLAGFLLIILAQPISGRALTLAILGMTFLYDAAAFAIGSIWGSRPLAPTISPKKSWEGLLAATFITFIVSIAVLPSIKPLTWGRSVGLAIVIAVFAPIGDLAESAMKRDLGVKDMGSILPGHGGIMDRIDSALFVIPAAFYFLRLIF